MKENEFMTNELTPQAKQWAMISHMVSLVGLLGNGIGFILGPVIVWMLKREDDPFIDTHGKASVNFQLSMMLYTLICAITIIGIILIPFLLIAMTVLPIIAGLKASNGEYYQYPLTIEFLK